MKISLINDAKNNLSQLIYEVESNDSEGLSQAILNWRTQLNVDAALTEPELEKLRAGGQGREFSWDKKTLQVFK